MQQKLDAFRAQNEARQDAGQVVDHRAAKAENLAARNPSKPEGTGPQQRQADSATQRPEGAPPQRPEDVAPRQRPGAGTHLNEVTSRDRSALESPGLRPSPELQQKLDDFRARKEARQDTGQAVDHREAKAENLAAREAVRRPSEGAAPAQQQRPQERTAAKQAETGVGQARNMPAETMAAKPWLNIATGADQGGGRSGDPPPAAPPAADDDEGGRRSDSAKHLYSTADRRNLPVEPSPNAGSGERSYGEHYRNETGAGSGPWFDEGTNHREGGAVQQMTEGSCVSAAGEMLTNGRVMQEQLHARLDDWSNPTALRNELNERDGGGWQGHYFASGDDAIRRASEGPMAAVVQAPGGAGHMVMLEPHGDGAFTVRDPYENSSYDVNSRWIDKYVSAGVWHE